MRNILLVFAFLFSTLNLCAENDFSEIPRLPANQEELLSVAGCVNVATGRFFQSGLGLEVESPETLRLATVLQKSSLGTNSSAIS